VSLILEALKKVERERAAAEPRGFLVVGPATWGSRSNAGWIAGIVAAAVVAGGAVYLATRPALPAPAAAAPAPAAAPASPARELRLMAISERDGAPIAVVNDSVVREGDRVDGARVLHIAPTEVVVEVGGARRTLRF
jgi:hypothetical protein